MNNTTTVLLLLGFTILIVFNVISLYNIQHTLDALVARGMNTDPADNLEARHMEAALLAAQRNSQVTSSSTLMNISSSSPMSQFKTSAWIYPGNPACSAITEYSDGRTIDILKPEYFTINNGMLQQLNSSNTRCNGYSIKNISLLKLYANEQYITVSSNDINGMGAFLAEALSSDTTVNTLVEFVVENDVTGIELDFEDFSSWSLSDYDDYKAFVTKLGNALHRNNKKLIIDAPAIANDDEQDWFLWRYQDFVGLPVDEIVIMAYDYQYDYGAGVPIAPLEWLRSVVTWTSAKYPREKLTVGLPSYGYQGVAGTYRITILTQSQISGKAGYSTAVRDASSGEMTWRDGTLVYYYNDSESLRQKRELVHSLGINHISIWHLGGNPWF